MNNENLNSHEERALDALLSEVLGKSGPPDLSQQILAQYKDGGKAIVVDVQPASRPVSKKSAAKPLVAALSVVTVLAASVLLLVWLQGQPGQPDDRESMVASKEIEPKLDPTTPVESIVQETMPVQPPLEQPRPRPVPKGIPLVVGDSDKLESNNENNDLRVVIEVPDRVSDPEAIGLVSKRVDAELAEHWKAIGVQPTEDSALPDVVARLNKQLGVKFSPESLSDPESLRIELINSTAASEIGRRWLAEVIGGGFSRIESDARQRLTKQIAETFQTGRRLDVTLAEWFAGASPQSSDWYAALSASGPDAMVHRAASLSMNVDLRCTRCHDAKVAGNGLNKDYLAFDMLIRQSVHRDPDGQWNVGEVKPPSNLKFYELPDGRQRMVQPSVPVAWMTSAAQQPIEDVVQWSRQMVASPELARGVVNSFWKLIHGRRLSGGVADTMTAPHSESLQQMEDQLVKDLLDSNFDVSRAMALIIHSPATRRSVPAALQPENSLLASDSELRAARDVVGAFAGSLPLKAKRPLNWRIDLAMRSAGGSIQSIREGNTINAQTNGSQGGNSSKPKLPVDGANGFPTAAGDVPVQWLNSVDGFDSRIEHLGYLAGLNRVPDIVVEAAEVMKKSDQISDELALHRVWWLLSP